MKAKRMTALALTLVLAAALGTTALAADENNPPVAAATQTPTLTMDNNGINSDTKTTFTGTIVATKIKVTVPLTVAFNIDPTKDAIASNKADGQITQPTFTITNNSLVPIWVRVSGVAVNKLSGNAAPTLVDIAPGATSGDNNKMMFGLKTDVVANFAKKADWMTVGMTGNYYLNADGKIPAVSAGSNTITPHIYGQITSGWTVGDKFTITPTFTVSVVNPGAART